MTQLFPEELSARLIDCSSFASMGGMPPRDPAEIEDDEDEDEDDDEEDDEDEDEDEGADEPPIVREPDED